MDFIPPTITTKTSAGKNDTGNPTWIGAYDLSKFAHGAWFAWNMLPPPSAPKIQNTANRPAKNLPPGMPLSRKTFRNVIHWTARHALPSLYSLRLLNT